MNYIKEYLSDTVQIISQIEISRIEKLVDLLIQLRACAGRLFFLGVGGGAGNASHAVNDFRKIVQIEAYAPTDNVSELTARINDDGWELSFVDWLKGSRLGANDMLFVFSVSGGNKIKGVSVNIVRALEYGQQVGATICGIVGRDGGYTAEVATSCVVVPIVNQRTITAHTETFQALLWHLIVFHPRLQQ